MAVIIKWIIKRKSDVKFPELTILTGVVSMFWIIIVLYSAPYVGMRYVVPILPLMILALIGAINYLFMSHKLKYGILIILILVTLFQLFQGDINYTYTGSNDKWQPILSNHNTPVIIISPEKRIFTINAVIQYLVDKDCVYVTTVE